MKSKTTTLLSLSLAILIFFFAAGCTKFNRLPDVTTVEVTDIQSNKALVRGEYLDTSFDITCGFCWGTKKRPNFNDSCQRSTPYFEGRFDRHIKGLAPTTEYYVRAYVTDGDVTRYGNELSFTTAEKPEEITKSLKAKVDDVDFSASSITRANLSNVMTVIGTSSGNESITLVFDADIKKGKYEVGSSSGIRINFTRGSASSSYTSTSGTLQITRNDSQPRVITGIFSAECSNDNGVVSITDGEFTSLK
ncbi:MAG: hypothetical protein JXQ87_10475 [Bacteroidia bacterium]